MEFLQELAESNCPVAYFPFAGEKMYLVNEPDLIKDVLVLNHRRFKKGRGLERAKILLGKGLLTSEGDAHRSQRGIVQPVFQHRYLQNYADIMVDRSIKLCGGWHDFELSPGQQIRPKPAMTLRSDCPIEMNLLKVPEPASAPSLDYGTIRPNGPPPCSC